MIELNYNGNTIKIHNDDSSYAYSALKSKPQLVLKFSLSEYIYFPVGTYCDFQGDRYVLKYADNLKKNGERDIEYTMTMGTDVDDLADYKMRNSVDGRLKFSMCATPKEFIEEIVAELNSNGTGSTWSVGECIESTEKTVEFNHTYIYDALASIAEKFDTEWEIVDHAISLRKVEYFKDSPLEVSYGKGCGFIPSVGRTIASDSRPIKRLYVQGGSDNIDKSKYGSSELHLPKSQSYTYKGHTYTSDKDGSYIERSDKTVQATKEDSLDCSEIYPSRVGTVTSVETVNKDKNFYDIIDNTIPDKLNFNDCIIEGETPTIIFQSGMLAGDGKEFEFKYTHTLTKDGETTAERRFEIVPQEIDGVVMPNETFKPKEGDKYAVFGIMLPDAYICDNDTKTGASWDMMKEAAQYLFEHEEQKYSFTGTLQGLWTKKRWTSIGGRFKVGSYIRFKDKQFMSDGVDLRITGIKQYVNSPYSPTIEISNQTAATGISTDLQKIDGTQVTIDDTKRDIVSYTKRRFRDAKETAEMLQNALLHFTDAINPITIATMQLLVGDESLQFDYVGSLTDSTLLRKEQAFTFDTKTKMFSTDATNIIHYTIELTDLTTSHSNSERKKWHVGALASAALTEGTKKYYLYIKAPHTSYSSTGVSYNDASFELSETAKSLDDGENYYFLAGILNSEYDGTRSFVQMNGFTEITPGQMIVDRVLSNDGKSFFDLLNNAMRLGDRLKFNVNGDGELLLNGTLVQSQSGDTAPLGCYRGLWNSTYVYYKGDEVTFTIDYNTSTYRYINDTPSKGIPPTSTTYWTVVAKGAQGMQGISPNSAFKSTAFIRQNITPSTPTGGSYSSPVPETTGWSDGIPSGEAILWASTRIFSSDGKSPQEDAWSTPKQMTDTADFDVEFSSETSPSAPSGHPNTTSGWSNIASESTIWMATSVKQNGVWSAWTVSKIKGENGNDGKSINIKGTLSSTSSLPTKPSDESDCYIIGGHLYVWDGDSWEDAGKFQGDAGKSAYIHIKYADSLTTGNWSSNNGETPSKYIGIYSDNEPEDKLTWSLYTWTKWKGDDGFGYEYIYKRTTDETAPSTPNLTSNDDDFVPTGWTNDPSGVTEEYPYEWVCYRKKTNDTWGSFIGSSSDNTVAALWANYSSQAGLNLLYQTEFESDEKMNKWGIKNGSISKASYQGHNGFSGVADFDSSYKDMLRQTIYESWYDHIITSNQWYTFSFYAKSDSGRYFGINETSVNFGFAQRTVYLSASHVARITVNGYCSSQTITEKRYLRVYINKSDWSWSNYVDIKDTSSKTVYMDVTVPDDGIYYIVSYVYPNTEDSKPTTASCTVSYYSVDRGHTLDTYIYPSCIDTGSDFIVDGVKQSAYSDGAVCWQLSSKWKRHTVTFYTQYSSDVQYVLFRLTASSNDTVICMPKLEVGKQATAYQPNNEDLHVCYYEYRYAKNGSTTTAPYLVTTDAIPSGWDTTQPTVSKGEYLWMIVAKKNSDGTLDGTWSTPVRITPYDGVDGDSPVMVYSGVYDSSKTYYGTKYRVDAVKYTTDGKYYVARTDAGEFSNVIPSNTDKWNSFGASFESVATNLLLAEGASIGDWWIEGGKIVSTLLNGTKITLDAKTPIIKVESTKTSAGTGDYSKNMDTNKSTTMSINAATGEIGTVNEDGVSYMSANGVFSNHAMTNALPASSGYTHYGAIVGLGFGNVAKDAWAINKDQTIIAGVYGRASNSNSNPCPSYGGYFNNLKVAGFILNTKYVDDGASYTDRQIGASVSQVIGLVDSGTTTIYLPTDAIDGKVIKIHQMGSGTLRIYPLGGQKIYDDASVNDYHDCGCGDTVECIFGKWNINSITTEVWIVRKYKF